MTTFNHNDCYYFGAAFHSEDFLRHPVPSLAPYVALYRVLYRV